MVKYLFGLLVVFVLFTSVCRADTMPGLAFLGGAKYSELVFQETPPEYAVSVFYRVNGFGSARDLIKVLADRGVPRLTIQLMWKDDHKFSRKDFPVILNRAKAIARMSEDFPGTDFRVSGACEHHMSKKTARALANALQGACPRCTIVNTPVKSGAILPEYVNELRVTRSRVPKGVTRYDLNFDGVDVQGYDSKTVFERFPNPETLYLWTPSFNGRKLVSDSTPRGKRTAWPTAIQIRKIVQLGKKSYGEKEN